MEELAAAHLQTVFELAKFEDDLVELWDEEYIQTLTSSVPPSNKKWLITVLLFLLSRFRERFEANLTSRLDEIYQLSFLTLKNEMGAAGVPSPKLTDQDIGERNKAIHFGYIEYLVETGFSYILGKIDNIVDKVDDGVPAVLVVREIVQKTRWKIKSIIVAVVYEIFSKTRKTLAKKLIKKTESGLVLCGRWDATLDNDTCGQCYKKHGDIVVKPEEFDPAPAHVHPNCRCVETYIYL